MDHHGRAAFRHRVRHAADQQVAAHDVETVIVTASPIEGNPDRFATTVGVVGPRRHSEIGGRQPRRRAEGRARRHRHGLRFGCEPPGHPRLRRQPRALSRRRHRQFRRFRCRPRPRRADRSLVGHAHRSGARRGDAAVRQPGHRRRGQRHQQPRAHGAAGRTVSGEASGALRHGCQSRGRVRCSPISRRATFALPCRRLRPAHRRLRHPRRPAEEFVLPGRRLFGRGLVFHRRATAASASPASTTTPNTASRATPPTST